MKALRLLLALPFGLLTLISGIAFWILFLLATGSAWLTGHILQDKLFKQHVTTTFKKYWFLRM